MSIAGVAVATMAIVVVLSVFNGFSRLSELHMSRIDPDLLLKPVGGKVFAGADSLARAISSIHGVEAAMPSLQERALMMNGNYQVPVVFKGVGTDYQAVVDVDSVIIDGLFICGFDTLAATQISVGVANRTGLRPGLTSLAELYVPRRQGRINPANPAAAFRGETLVVSGVTQVDQADYDADRIIIPIDVARRLLDYDDEASAIEVSLTEGSDLRKVAGRIAEVAGDGFEILDRRMQQGETFRMIAVEKWVTFRMLVFILVIASFNVISTLSLLVVEKRSDMSTFRALGASRSFVRRVFIAQGFMVSVLGGLAGIVAGIALSLAQQHFGIIKLSGDPAALTIDVYPVAVDAADIAVVAAAVILVAAVIAQVTRLFTKNIR